MGTNGLTVNSNLDLRREEDIGSSCMCSEKHPAHTYIRPREFGFLVQSEVRNLPLSVHACICMQQSAPRKEMSIRRAVQAKLPGRAMAGKGSEKSRPHQVPKPYAPVVAPTRHLASGINSEISRDSGDTLHDRRIECRTMRSLIPPWPRRSPGSKRLSRCPSAP